MADSTPPSGNSGAPGDRMNRRDFLRVSGVAATGVAALAASLAPLREFDDFPTLDAFLQKYYKELTPEEMAKVLKRIEDEVQRQYGVRPKVRDLKPMDGVEFVYCLNLTRCIGCRKCVHACVAENNQSRNPEVQYIRVLRLPHGSLDIEKSEHNYAPESVPEKGYFYRSDHFNFSKEGVPAFYPHRGIEYIGKPEGWGMQMRAQYVAEDYHKPSDQVKDNWDMSGAAEDSRLFLLVGYRVANADAMPEWRPGNEFKAKRDASLRGK